MAIGVGATSKGRSASTASQATGGVTTAVSGSTFYVSFEWDTANFSSISDSKGNAYTIIDTELTVSGTQKQRVYYCQNGVGGATHSVTVNLSGAAPISVFFLEITGGATTGVLDQHNRANDAATPFASPSVTTLQAAEILVSSLTSDTGSNPGTIAESTGFTVQAGASETNGASFYVGGIATRIVAAIASYASSFTCTGTTISGVAIATFKEAAAGGDVLMPQSVF